MSGSPGSVRHLFRNREFVALASTAFARSQAYSTILIALALYADLFNTSGAVEGLFGTAFAAAQLVIVLPLGRLIDVGNAKRYLVAGLLLNVGVFVGFSFVSAVEHVVAMRVVQGVGASLLWITGTAVVGEISPDESRGLWLGAYNQVGAVSSLAGDVFGGLLLYLYGFRTTYAVLIAVTAFATLSVVLFLRDNPGGKKDADEATGVQTLRNLLGRTAVRALVTFRLAFSVGKMAVIIFLPIYARTEFGISALLIGGILAGGKLTKSLLQGTVGEYTDRVGSKHHFVLAGALLYAVGTALIPFAEYGAAVFPTVSLTVLGDTLTLVPAFFALFTAYGLIGVADSLRLPASMALFVEEGEQFDAVAGSMSLRSIAWKVGQVSGPVAVGALWDATSVFVAFWTAAAFIVVSSGAFAVLYDRDPIGDATTVASTD
ncbi:MFS transporter [Halostella sp. JP-L12]|uniref:MFS transporter n=1 Tax=Halostella TaxID=1843185 RepID=UPI000EF7B7A4|nr:MULTISPECIES: MFS transporter [Halostella]NHN49596.1 MFS transporter [Halostella sp. JP-L12]